MNKGMEERSIDETYTTAKFVENLKRLEGGALCD